MSLVQGYWSFVRVDSGPLGVVLCLRRAHLGASEMELWIPGGIPEFPENGLEPGSWEDYPHLEEAACFSPWLCRYFPSPSLR
jgi:hypothetical protein